MGLEMTDETAQRARDAEEHRKAYHAIMKFSAEFGVPFSLALTMFFTNLVMANGFLVALFAGLVTHFFVFLIVKLFFSH